MTTEMASSLDGLQLDYTYEDGGGRILASFSGSQLEYRWLSGPFEGVEESGLRYRSRKLGDGLYLVNWHDVENRNFATLLIDLVNMNVHSSALLYYGTNKEREHFSRARITNVS